MPLRDGTRSGFVGKDFRWVIAPKYQHAGEFADGLALIATERKWGYVDRSGNEIVPPKYDSVWQFSEGVGRTRVDTPPAETSMTMEGPRKVYRYQFGFVDTHGREVIRPRFQSATDFQQGRAFVIPAESGKWAIFDKQGLYCIGLSTIRSRAFAKVWPRRAWAASGGTLTSKAHG